MTTEGKPVNPGSRSISDRLLLFIGSLGYLGFVPAASGTISVAVVGIPLSYLLRGRLDLTFWPYLLIVIAITCLSIYIAGEADRVLNEQDSSKNVIDEIPGYLITLVGLPFTWKIVLAAFFIERAIDIAKIWPASWVEDHLPRGWGVVMDDVVAGIYALILLHLVVYFWPAVLT